MVTCIRYGMGIEKIPNSWSKVTTAVPPALQPIVRNINAKKQVAEIIALIV